MEYTDLYALKPNLQSASKHLIFIGQNTKHYSDPIRPRTRIDAHQTRLRKRLLTDIRRSRQSSTRSTSTRTFRAEPNSSFASRILEKFDDLANISSDISSPRSGSPAFPKIPRCNEAKPQTRVAVRPKSMLDKPNRPEVKSKEQAFKDSIVVEYRKQQKNSLKILKYTVPRSMMTKRQQKQLLGKVSISYKRVKIDPYEPLD
jgi:hypothetical protein